MSALNINEEEDRLREVAQRATPDEIDKLRIILYKAKKKAKGKHFTGYIPTEYLPYVQIVIDYLYDREIIKRKSYYALTTFAVENLITTVIQQIKQSQGTPKKGQF